MSATLDASPVAQYLDRCPILRSEGRLFDLSIKHLPYSPEPLEVQVRNAVELLGGTGHSGDTLVFLPGAAEIGRAMRACETLARKSDLLMLPLYGSLPAKEQDRALSPAGQRKLILATNVAESSVTVEGVTAVIDSGLARFATYSHWSGLPVLQVGRVSKASATQRAGRAGRTAPGRVLRLYTEQDYSRRVDHDSPEILRTDLSQLCLSLRAIGIQDVNDVAWLDPPSATAVERAAFLLDRLGATAAMAQRLARFPLHPRLSRILVEAVERGVGESGCVVVALLGSGVRVDKNDLLAAMDSELDHRTQQHVSQLRRIVRISGQTKHNDDAVLMSILSGFPDRVARLRAGNQVLLSTGGSAELLGAPPQYEFMVAADVEERKEKPLPLIRMTARVEPEWLIDLFPDHVTDQSEVVWNRAAERVDAVSEMRYDALVIQESRGTLPDPEAAANLLAAKALEAGIERLADVDMLSEFMGRVEFAGFDVPDVAQVLGEMCWGRRSFAELKREATGLISALEQKVGARRLSEGAPATIRLRSGRQTKVHYERGKPPWIASRMQDFFGMKDTPRIGPQRTPVVVHLLAPNQRAVQTTTDLAGFWERLYPEVRRELMRRYPRHAWPERPV
jgi:ATP-dependent helicase HrpB